MSSVIFQPLLHDPLGWKSSNSTYADTFKWKKYRSTNKDKIISAYSQKYQRQLQKQKQQQKLQQINTCLPSTTNEEQTIQRVILGKKNEEKRGPPPVSYRYTPSKTATAVVEEPPVFIVEYKQRPASTNREANCGSKASQRLPTEPAATEETCRSATSLEARRSSKEEKEKVPIDSNNDNSRHWLAFPRTKTPEYLIDIKKRLGQLKIRSAPPVRSLSVSNAPTERPQSSASHHQQQQSAEQRHIFDFSLPETPNELRAARHRLEKHRYNPSLDNYPPRPKTCPVHTNDIPKPLTPPIASESEDEQIPSIETTQTKDDIWVNNQENKTKEDETSSVLVQMIDVDNLPKEYVEALETANAAQDEYIKNLKTNDEKRSENFVYRLPSMSSDNKNESIIAYHNQQQSKSTINNNSIHRNDFGTWVRNATDKERESAMKILHDVLHQPIIGYDIPTKQQTKFKQAPAPPPVRTNSTTRKLGRTRTHQQIPCERCEKQLIKRHIWNLNRSDTSLCSHKDQEIKPPIIEVRV